MNLNFTLYELKKVKHLKFDSLEFIFLKSQKIHIPVSEDSLLPDTHICTTSRYILIT